MLSVEEIRDILRFLGRTQITGNEAERLVYLKQKLGQMALAVSEDDGETTSSD